MAFVTDKSELKPGLVLFRRGDVDSHADSSSMAWFLSSLRKGK